MAQENKKLCDDCNASVEELYEVNCVGGCARFLNVCSSCEDDPYVCKDCEDGSGSGSEEPSDEGQPETD